MERLVQVRLRKRLTRQVLERTLQKEKKTPPRLYLQMFTRHVFGETAVNLFIKEKNLSPLMVRFSNTISMLLTDMWTFYIKENIFLTLHCRCILIYTLPYKVYLILTRSLQVASFCELLSSG